MSIIIQPTNVLSDDFNRGTLASRSVALLRSTYRWMLTGTPVTNTLYVSVFLRDISDPQITPSADIYGLIRFGRFRPWNDWESFRDFVVCSFVFSDILLLILV